MSDGQTAWQAYLDEPSEDRVSLDDILHRDVFMAGRRSGAAASSSEGLRERTTLLETLLHELTDHEDKPCSLDHHGCCQEHGWFDESECIIVRCRAALAASPEPEGEN